MSLKKMISALKDKLDSQDEMAIAVKDLSNGNSKFSSTMKKNDKFLRTLFDMQCDIKEQYLDINRM